MIGALRGEVIEIDRSGEGAAELVVDVHGVGYRVSVTGRHATAIAARDSEIQLSVHTHVREGAIQLFGFPDAAERRTFELLLGAHGVGPALALAIIGVLPPEALFRAIASADLDALMLVPGVGRKTAQRLQLELAQRLELSSIAPLGIGSIAALPASQREVHEALVTLGYSPEEIRVAIEELPSEGSVEELLRQALGALAPSR
jgi:Holliday junction DNA helicase RuvA